MTRRWLSMAHVLLAAVLLPGDAVAAKPAQLPEIRTSETNRVPRCVTPDRLMAFLKSRNPRPDPRFRDIAHWYKHWGEAWRVRWDYAFFQMAIETNFLSYRQPNGKMGDVDPRQNNFAGIGTTGGGVPGDSYPDVKTGVLAQIQHLVAYSGERLASPVAPRTQLKQDDIIEASARLNRSVQFSDLSRRWAVDPKYGSSIAWVAEQFRQQQCPNPNAAPPEEIAEKPAPRPQPARKAPSQVVAATAAPVNACFIQSASYGGQASVLLQHDTARGTEYTVLTVLDGFERSMTDQYIEARAPGAQMIGQFHAPDAALAMARSLCGPASGHLTGLEASAR